MVARVDPFGKGGVSKLREKGRCRQLCTKSDNHAALLYSQRPGKRWRGRGRTTARRKARSRRSPASGGEPRPRREPRRRVGGTVPVEGRGTETLRATEKATTVTHFKALCNKQQRKASISLWTHFSVRSWNSLAEASQVAASVSIWLKLPLNFIPFLH